MSILTTHRKIKYDWMQEGGPKYLNLPPETVNRVVTGMAERDKVSSINSRRTWKGSIASPSPSQLREMRYVK